MAPTKKRLGIGAECSVLVTRLHPGDKVSAAYPYATKGQRVTGLLATGIAERIIRRQTKIVVTLRHDSNDSVTEPFDCWAHQQFVSCTKEGPAESFFPEQGATPAVANGAAAQPQNQNQNLDATVSSSSCALSASELCRECVLVASEKTAVGLCSITF